MLMWVAGVGYKDGYRDPLGENTKADIIGLGISKVSEVKTLQTYVIEGDVNRENVEKAGRELLADSIIQYFNFSAFDGKHLKNLVKKRGVWAVEVFFKSGVMDVVGLSVAKAIEVMGINGAKVRTGTTYVISGNLTEREIKNICEKCLANGLIQTYNYKRL